VAGRFQMAYASSLPLKCMGKFQPRFCDCSTEWKVSEAAQLRRAPRLRNEAEERDIGRSKPESKYSSSQIMNTMAKILLRGGYGRISKTTKSIVIVPYGNIGSFPFSAIPVEGNKTLIDFASIEVAPSLVDLYGAWAGSNVMGGSMESPDGTVKDISGFPPGCDGDTKGNEDDPDWGSPLIVGDPDYSSDPDFVFPQLAGAKSEAIEVADIFDVDPLIGREATLTAVEELMENATILYFATHGVSYSEDGLQGFIALSEGRLTAKSVQKMCLARAKLAVLSACQTGLGQSADGGTIGLTRAFQIAGVDHVVMEFMECGRRCNSVSDDQICR
jgi:hypothetical protein